MDNRSRGFRLAAAAVMLVFLLAVSAFAMAEADPIRVSSLSEPQSVIMLLVGLLKALSA